MKKTQTSPFISKLLFFPLFYNFYLFCFQKIILPFFGPLPASCPCIKIYEEFPKNINFYYPLGFFCIYVIISTKALNHARTDIHSPFTNAAKQPQPYKGKLIIMLYYIKHRRSCLKIIGLCLNQHNYNIEGCVNYVSY